MSDLTDDRYLAVEFGADGPVVRLNGDFRSLTQANAGTLGDLLDPIARRLGACRLVLDLRDVDFLSTAALGTFIRLHQLLQAQGGRLALRELEEKVYEVFEVTRLVRLLDVRPALGPTPSRPAES
jgi:anti-anti-sigma factor